MDALFRIVSAIPGAVWGACVGSCLTLLGVLLSNRESRKRHLAQLKHDTDQRDRERQLSWRRDVYLEAAQSISRGFSFLGRLLDLNTSDQELSTAYQEDLSRIAKIQVVATEKTVQAVTAFSNEFTSVYLKLSLDRIPLVKRKNAIELLDMYSEKSSHEIDRYVELMKRLNLEGNADERLWKVINDYVEFERTRREQSSQQRQALATQQGKEHLALIKSFIDQNLRLAMLIPPALFAVRSELELPLNREEYMKSFKESLERNKANMDSFLERIQRSPDG